MSETSEFGYPVVVCDDFDDVIARRGREADLDEVVKLAVRHGRLLLQAPGGAGKTWTLHRISELATRKGYRVSFVEVQRLDRAALEVGGVDALLRASEPRLTYEELGGGDPLLLLVDGLSEASSDMAELVLSAVDDWAALGPTTGTIVADRLTRRALRSRRWLLATLGPVSKSTIAETLGRAVDDAEYGFLSSPVNLALSTQLPDRAENRSGAIRAVMSRAKLSSDQWQRLDELALNVYRVRRRRSFPKSWIDDSGSDDVYSELKNSELLIDLDEQDVSFIHHLFHDFLAARAAARKEAAWGHELFDDLTLRSSSHDALVLMLEMVAPSQRPKLIRSVYDWNLYAASYLLSRDRMAHGDTDETTEHQILALLGERRFDHFLATRRQVEDALILHGGPLASDFRNAASVQDVVRLASEALPQDETYQAWLMTFAVEERPSPMWLIERMRDVDGVDGWTAANVVRRLGIDDRGRRAVEELATDASDVLRWRAVHALGVAGPPALPTLFGALKSDGVVAVRFGALRSIVDQAYLSPTEESRKDIFRELATHSAQIIDEPTLSRELARVLFVDEAPAGWVSATSIVLQSILAIEADESELDKWREIGAGVRIQEMERA